MFLVDRKDILMKRSKKRKHAWCCDMRTLMGILILCLLSFTVPGILENKEEQPAAYESEAYLPDEGGSESTCIADPDSIPDYSGEDYIVLNGGRPNFTEWELSHITGEHYSELDGLSRCGTAVAMLSRDMMPTEKRGDIGEIRPSGWKQKKYEDLIDESPPYLYNRSHLIAYALTGQEANEKNLITGTRYLNATTMLPWEERVMRYLDRTEGHVLYRVTPYFKGSELVARGVEMEAYSVEDHGKSICYHVFLYNIQPGIIIDYATGKSAEEQGKSREEIGIISDRTIR